MGNFPYLEVSYSSYRAFISQLIRAEFPIVISITGLSAPGSSCQQRHQGGQRKQPEVVDEICGFTAI